MIYVRDITIFFVQMTVPSAFATSNARSETKECLKSLNFNADLVNSFRCVRMKKKQKSL